MLSLFSNYSHAQKLVIGTYTNTGSKGIYVYNFNAKTGKATQLSYILTDNPSFVVAGKNNQFIYSVNENEIGKVSAFKVVGNYLSFINSQPSMGSAPCYISLDKTGKWLFIGNYGSGSLSVYAVKTGGAIGNLQQVIQHTGCSVNKERQASPHVHCTYISEDNKNLFVPDLGLDKIMIYPFNASTGILDTAKKSWTDIKAGGGPRHIIFNKRGTVGYLVEEMSGAVNIIKKNGDRYKIIQTENHLPNRKEGAGGDIHLSPDEKFLYVSQRSNSTIEIYKIDASNGRIHFIAAQSVAGKFPRNFTIHPSGDFLLSANQKSNDITIFKIDKTTGMLTKINENINLDIPVCLQWIGD